MEGNYAKALVEKRDKIFDSMFGKLQEAVKAKQQETRSVTAVSTLPSTAALAATDVNAALAVLGNMVGYATDLERIV